MREKLRVNTSQTKCFPVCRKLRSTWGFRMETGWPENRVCSPHLHGYEALGSTDLFGELTLDIEPHFLGCLMMATHCGLLDLVAQICAYRPWSSQSWVWKPVLVLVQAAGFCLGWWQTDCNLNTRLSDQNPIKSFQFCPQADCLCDASPVFVSKIHRWL